MDKLKTAGLILNFTGSYEKESVDKVQCKQNLPVSRLLIVKSVIYLYCYHSMSELEFEDVKYSLKMMCSENLQMQQKLFTIIYSYFLSILFPFSYLIYFLFIIFVICILVLSLSSAYCPFLYPFS